MTARPIFVGEASPPAPTMTVRCVRAGRYVIGVVTDTEAPRGRVGLGSFVGVARAALSDKQPG